jgi:hypothetical protein
MNKKAELGETAATDEEIVKWIIRQLGDEPQDDGADGIGVAVRWEPGVGFVHLGQKQDP